MGPFVRAKLHEEETVSIVHVCLILFYNAIVVILALTLAFFIRKQVRQIQQARDAIQLVGLIFEFLAVRLLY